MFERTKKLISGKSDLECAKGAWEQAKAALVAAENTAETPLSGLPMHENLAHAEHNVAVEEARVSLRKAANAYGYALDAAESDAIDFGAAATEVREKTAQFVALQAQLLEAGGAALLAVQSARGRHEALTARRTAAGLPPPREFPTVGEDADWAGAFQRRAAGERND